MQDDGCVFGTSLSGSGSLLEAEKSLSKLVFSLRTKQAKKKKKKVAEVVVGYQFSRKAT